MARIFQCGFEIGASIAWYGNQGSIPGAGQLTHDTSNPRTGNFCMLTSSGVSNVAEHIFGAKSTIYGRVCFHYTTIDDDGTGWAHFMGLWSGTAPLFTVGINPQGYPIVRVNPTITSGTYDKIGNGGTVYTASQRAPVNVWNVLEFGVFFGTSSDGWFVLRLNGITLISQTGLTFNAGSADRVRFGLEMTSFVTTMRIDDYALNDTFGSENTSWPGFGGIVALLPNADVDVNWQISGGTVHWDAVNENDGDTSYVYPNSANLYEVFDVENMPPDSTDVRAVEVVFLARRVAAGAGSMVDLIRSGTVEDIGVTHNILQSDVYKTYFGKIWDVNPDGSVSWTVQAVDALQVGLKSL